MDRAVGFAAVGVAVERTTEESNLLIHSLVGCTGDLNLDCVAHPTESRFHNPPERMPRVVDRDCNCTVVRCLLLVVVAVVVVVVVAAAVAANNNHQTSHSSFRKTNGRYYPDMEPKDLFLPFFGCS